MCWSGQASAVLATVGLGTTAYAAYRKEPAAIWMPLGYFSLMELLQAFTYSVIDQCSLPSNQIATLLGYLHIAFQPFFINAVSMHFIPDQARARGLRRSSIRCASCPPFSCCCNSIHSPGPAIAIPPCRCAALAFAQCTATRTSPGRVPPTVCATALPTGSGTASQAMSSPECSYRYCTGRGG